jgi:hypothetical protein
MRIGARGPETVPHVNSQPANGRMTDVIAACYIGQCLSSVSPCKSFLALVDFNFGLRPIKPPRALARPRPSLLRLRGEFAPEFGLAAQNCQHKTTVRRSLRGEVNEPSAGIDAQVADVWSQGAQRAVTAICRQKLRAREANRYLPAKCR